MSSTPQATQPRYLIFEAASRRTIERSEADLFRIFGPVDAPTVIAACEKQPLGMMIWNAQGEPDYSVQRIPSTPTPKG